MAMSDDRDVDIEQWLDNLDVNPADARDARHMRRIIAAVDELNAAVAGRP